MSQVETVKIADSNRRTGFLVINADQYDPKKHKLFDKEEKERVEAAQEAAKLSPAAQEIADQESARREFDAKRGQVNGGGVNDGTRNPSGTFSEPTPTDIRYPDKTQTEFENNMGAHIGKSASQMRQAMGLPDAPGGIDPAGALKTATEQTDLRGMKVAELREFAEQHQIDVGEAKTKRELVAAIEEAVEAAGEEGDEERTE